MLRPTVYLSVLGLVLSAPSIASADTTVSAAMGDYVAVLGGADPMDVEIDSPAANTIRVVNLSPADALSVFPAVGGACIQDPVDTVTCAGLTAQQFNVQAFGGGQPDSIAVAASATFAAQLYGGGGGDVLLGGGGSDRLSGGFGDDDLDGRGGSDLVENGYNNSNVATSDDDSDTYRDTGISGSDSLNFGPQTVAVHLKVDDLPNDGGAAGAEGDNVKGGFEKLRGTMFGDVIVGGAAPEIINGSRGDDDITGGAGADTIEGNEGVDTVRGRDGEADLKLDCDSASSVTQGAGETVFVDAIDPAPERCEIIDRLAVPDPGNGGGTTPDPAPTGGGAPAPNPETTPPPIVPLRLGAVNVTETVSRMPRVTGKKFASARDEVLNVVAFAQVEIEFKRGCKKGEFLEITKQTPITGASLSNDARSPAQISLVACIAEVDYLNDCDMAGIKADVKRLGNKALDADVALSVLGTVNRCKVDYDIKIAKAAEEAKIKLEAQRASEALAKAQRDKANAKKQAQDKIKADIKANITCPIGGSLNVGVIDGYTPNRNALGLRAAAFKGDPQAWTLPSHSRADYQSFLEVVVTDRGAQFPEARVFVDTDDVTDADTVSFGRKDVKTTKDGRTVISVRPQKPGVIRICAVVQTGADEVISTGLEVKVIGQPKVGSIYETQSGRRVKLTPNGPVAEKSAAVAAALAADGPRATRANIFDDAWNALVGLFSGRSNAVNAQPSAGGEGRVRTAAVAEKARVGVGQITRTGQLSSDPQLPVLNLNGRCFTSRPDGTLALLTCPTLDAPSGTALVGMSNDGKGVMAFGHGNVIRAVPQNTVPAGLGKLIGMDGSTLIGNDGSTLIGNDGSTLIGNDGSTLIGLDGSTLTGALGVASLTVAPAQVVARDGAGLLDSSAGLVNAGGLN